jgi:hypothetical protein
MSGTLRTIGDSRCTSSYTESIVVHVLALGYGPSTRLHNNGCLTLPVIVHHDPDYLLFRPGSSSEQRTMILAGPTSWDFAVTREDADMRSGPSRFCGSRTAVG